MFDNKKSTKFSDKELEALLRNDRERLIASYEKDLPKKADIKKKKRHD